MGFGLFKILAHSTLPRGGPEEVGNKAWNLMRMAAAGLPVPAAFVLPTAWCGRMKANERDLAEALSSGIAALEAATGLGFGSPRRPLLVSVRSGAAASMPGMLETVLNIGINGEILEGLIGHTGNPRLAWDCYRRLVQGFAEVVEGLPRAPFDELVQRALSTRGVLSENELDYQALRELASDLLKQFNEMAGVPFPSDPSEQLRRAVEAVFRSWDSPKATTYRRAKNIANDTGTAVTVQRMVFGNAGGASGAGVAFTRNPATGARELYADFQFNGQGEDVVAGRQEAGSEERLRRAMPFMWTQLEQASRTLEALFHDAQDFEFTVESGKLYLLQSRTANRTPWAALRIAVDQVDEGLIDSSEALARLSGIDLNSVSRTRFATPKGPQLATAQVASIGVASGAIALDSEAAVRTAAAGTPVILVRRETETADVEGIFRAAGILTGTGGKTSHAAVVARQLGKVCLVACRDLEIDLSRRCCRIGDRALQEGDFLSLDGNDGSIYHGSLEVFAERPEPELARVAGWSGSKQRCA